jgi:hypothetical protein
MCPSCIANVAVMAFGLTSTGGLTAFLWKKNTSCEEETQSQGKDVLDHQEDNHS